MRKYSKSEMLEGFISKTHRVGECLIWDGAKKHARYGSCRYEGKAQSAHRVSYKLFVGEIPVGMEVCHTCDNGLCVEPSHLFLGTHADNMQDCARKGRLNNRSMRLTESVVLEMRQKRANGSGMRELAREYGVSSGHASCVLNRKVWKHV